MGVEFYATFTGAAFVVCSVSTFLIVAFIAAKGLANDQ